LGRVGENGIENQNFTHENMKVEKLENLCCQGGTTVRVLGAVTPRFPNIKISLKR